MKKSTDCPQPTESTLDVCVICVHELWWYCTHHECEIPDAYHNTCEDFVYMLEEHK